METNSNKRSFIITVRARLLIGFMTLSLPLLILMMFLIPKVDTVVYLSQKFVVKTYPKFLIVKYSKHKILLNIGQ